MATTLTHTSELTGSIPKIESYTISEKLQRINKIKYNLGLLYFAGLTILLTTLFI